MSKIEVDQVDPQSGTTLTLGTSGDTITIPSGVTLANNGTATGFASIDWQSTIVTGATHTASANQGIWLDTSSNAITLTLPASPSVGDQLIFSDFARNWGSNSVTLSLNGSKYQGNTSPAPDYNTTGETVHIVYSGATQGWIPINDGSVRLETPQSYNADLLVVAGGGAGGQTSGHGGGGGGAGGFRTASSVSLTGGATYTITIGQGGTAGTALNNGTAGQGGNGGDSTISGTGITTVTSTGGGGGGSAVANNGAAQIGKDGGSGGGSGAYATNAGGSGNTPSTTPSQGNNGGHMVGSPYNGGAGGGGANAVGQNVTTNTMGGSGGDGTANSITGSSVTYAGGGGGGCPSAGPVGAGGAGGGGAGARENNSDSVAGTANTGGGGGGANQSSPSNFVAKGGGSGVVIISVPDANYSGTVTGSPTVNTGVGGKTVITFNGDGTYVA